MARLRIIKHGIDEAIKVYEEFRRFKNDGFIESIDTDFFFNLTDIILSAYKRVLKENEELTISNKEIDKECSRLEKKEVELINENEHYKDLIYALKTYYDITEEDFEIVQKQDEIDIGDIQETEIKNDGINYYEYKNNGATESGYSKNYSVNDIETRLKINELVQALKQLDKRVRKLED